MNKSASLMMEQYADIVFGYGFNNGYRYVILLQITVHGVHGVKELIKTTVRKQNICFEW